MTTDKSKGLVNEFQQQLIYLIEMVDRLEYFNQISEYQAKPLRTILKDVKNSTDKLLDPSLDKDKDLTKIN